MRDRAAVAALCVFILVIVLCLLAPVYAAWANVDPFRSTLDAVIKVNGQDVPVMEHRPKAWVSATRRLAPPGNSATTFWAPTTRAGT